MAIIASGLAEWDVNVNPKSHYEVSIPRDSEIPEDRVWAKRARERSPFMWRWRP